MVVVMVVVMVMATGQGRKEGETGRAFPIRSGAGCGHDSIVLEEATAAASTGSPGGPYKESMASHASNPACPPPKCLCAVPYCPAAHVDRNRSSRREGPGMGRGGRGVVGRYADS